MALLVIAGWFLLGWFGARIISLEERHIGTNGLAWPVLTFFIGGLGWLFAMMCATSPRARRKAHFIPKVAKIPVVTFLRNKISKFAKNKFADKDPIKILFRV